jgi:hypothetical protein
LSWAQVRSWRDDLWEREPPPTGLSRQGAQEAWHASLTALDDQALNAVADMRLAPWKRAAVVCASTVFTAPIEWCAVLLGRGSEVVLKVPSSQPQVATPLVQAAQAVGLPLRATVDRSDLHSASYVVAMGSDASLADIGATLPPTTRFEPHGHRFSVAWIGGSPLQDDPLVPADFSDAYGALAADAALHDGRGCLSPVVLISTDTNAVDSLADTLARAEQRWPRGEISDLEAASIRARGALAAATGTVRSGARWSVHGLPAEQWQPIALPRSVAVIQVENREEAARILAPFWSRLSTIGTDQPWTNAPRTCRLGRLQRPPLLRHHDGVDWLRTTSRSGE